MYAIAEIIYGIPLCTSTKVKNAHGMEHLEEDATRTERVELALEGQDPDDENVELPLASTLGEVGFNSPYSGSSDATPASFGVILGAFDEACHHTELGDLCLQPTDEQKAAYQAAWDALPEALRADLAVYGEPRVFFLWSTS